MLRLKFFATPPQGRLLAASRSQMPARQIYFVTANVHPTNHLFRNPKYRRQQPSTLNRIHSIAKPASTPIIGLPLIRWAAPTQRQIGTKIVVPFDEPKLLLLAKAEIRADQEFVRHRGLSRLRLLCIPIPMFDRFR